MMEATSAADVAKTEPLDEGLSDSLPSSPEAEAFPPENPGTQKRKGGRKPIYATSEERKQRNRQAQAAFRERRTEYIKQLETTIKHHEDTLQNLQLSHRNAADECLMLRYKNSLLERILLEKGIDVQAELRAKTGSPNIGPSHVSPASGPINPPTTAQRAVMNRHNQARRSASGFTPKMEAGQPIAPGPPHPAFSSGSPQTHTTSSQSSSPVTSISPGFGPQGVITPSASDRLAQPPQQQQQRLQPQPRSLPPSHLGFSMPGTAPNVQQNSFLGAAPTKRQTGTYYPPSPFQNHIDQLGKLSRFLTPIDSVSTEQEYDAEADMIDEQDPGDPSPDPGSYPQAFPPGSTSVPQPAPAMMQNIQTPQSVDGTGPVFRAMDQLFDPYDPALDADPFGLSASMTFPTPFSFEMSSMRH